MGAATQRRRQFLAANPRCAFCAGEGAAEEEDHQPARAFFRDRKWPERFVFPACGACNRISGDAENVVSLLAFDPTADNDRTVYQERVAYLRTENPELLDRLSMSANEKRRAMEKLGFSKPLGALFSDISMVRLESSIWDPYVRLVGRKIMLALHYQCFGEPLSRSGGLWLYWQTNTSYQAIVNKDILDLASRFVQPIREKKCLSDQFSIRWNSLTDPKCGLFIVHLQKALVFGGITAEKPELVPDKLRSKALRPLKN